MLKFHCSHCSGRLALQERHLGRLVHCPECGGITHPMAGEILARQKSKEKIDCDNCGHTLGRLQKPRRWGKCTVCGSCYRALRTEQIEHDGVIAENIGEPARRSTVSVRTLERNAQPPFTTPATRRQLAGPVVQPAGQSHFAIGNFQSDLGPMIRAAAAGLLLCVAAVIVLMYVIRAISSLLLWTVAIAVIVAGAIVVARGVLAIRQRLRVGGDGEPGSAVASARSMMKRLLRSPATQHAARTVALVVISGGIYLMYLIGSATLSRGEGR